MTTQSETRPVVFAVYREAAGAVFSSQVVGPVAWLAGRGLGIRLLSFVPVGAWLRAPARRSLRALQVEVKARLDRAVSWLPAMPSRQSRDPLARWELEAWLYRHHSRRPVVLHCRGVGMTDLALQLRHRRSDRVVFDCRGICHAEFAYERKSMLAPEALASQARAIRAMEERCAREADAVLCVSQAMADYVITEFGVNQSRVRVVPCAVNVAPFLAAAPGREAVRAELGFGDRLVVTYCGGLHGWQLPEQGLRIFRLIRRFEPQAHFFALTTQPETMRTVAQREGLAPGDMTVLRVPHEQVPRYLVAGDLGLLLRAPSLVNAVASPVKFGEYLAAGLPVILTEGVGDFSELTRRDRLGCMFPLDLDDGDLSARLEAFVTGFRSQTPDYRRRCVETAQRVLAPEVCYPVLEALYAQLAESVSTANGR